VPYARCGDRKEILMILKQYYLGCLAHASYLLGDEASSTAIIVDPQRDSTLSTLGNLASKSATSS